MRSPGKSATKAGSSNRSQAGVLDIQSSPNKPQPREASSSQLDSAGPIIPVTQRRLVRKSWAWGALVLLLGLILYSSRGETLLSVPDYDDDDATKFVVADLPGKGKGLVAVRDIEQGELLIREKPLFRVPFSSNVFAASDPKGIIAKGLRDASSEGRDAFLNLSYIGLPDTFDPAADPQRHALAIFQTNAVSAGDMVGIFPRMARLNHGCASAFNSVYSWREREGALVVHALKPIPEGSELLTTYFDTKRPRDDRRRVLYWHSCTCSVCSLPEAKSRAVDRQLSDMTNEYGRLATWAEGQITGLEAIRTVHLLWRLGTSTGYWSERGRLAADAAWVAAAHHDERAARSWAALAKQWYTYELGADSAEVEETMRIMADPTSHPAWGTRQRLSVGDTRGLR
ncbi:hypothetical protein BD626DRAFT_406364 [Schizophyllum amplum]|uniref:SET domain-containing protein n=1 Tax=Schizophyllum amplum TaxID=97359 RepID=A0A550C8N5_9AGAR|nr:hypothetical protein BD626DRAFT_406364 [Auriculariopsis ampla]